MEKVLPVLRTEADVEEIKETRLRARMRSTKLMSYRHEEQEKAGQLRLAMDVEKR